MATFNLAELIGQVRAMEARIKQREDEFDEKMKPFNDWCTQKREEILQHLNSTGQKSAATPEGTAYWAAKTTYRVIDKEEFRRHVIGSAEWQLTTFAAAPSECEAFTTTNGHTPPGLERNSIRLLHLNAPVKPKVKKVLVNTGETVGQDDNEFPEIGSGE